MGKGIDAVLFVCSVSDMYPAVCGIWNDTGKRKPDLYDQT